MTSVMNLLFCNLTVGTCVLIFEKTLSTWILARETRESDQSLM